MLSTLNQMRRTMPHRMEAIPALIVPTAAVAMPNVHAACAAMVDADESLTACMMLLIKATIAIIRPRTTRARPYFRWDDSVRWSASAAGRSKEFARIVILGTSSVA